MANIIKIKRGLSKDLSNASLSEGEMAFTTDTKKLYISDTTEPINKDTTYSLSKSGSTITLTGSDGSSQSVSDSNTTYNAATQSANGLMSSTDKTKLDGIATGANNYSLPTASSSTLGGVKVGTNLSISNGVLSATDTKYNAATTSAAGLMSASDKTKLDGIATGATKITVDTALSSSSTNPVQNKVINTALANKANTSAIPTKTSQLTNDSGFKTTDNNTTYSISKSGSTITLTGSDGSTTSVTDSDTNTTYGVVSTSAAGLCPQRGGTTTKFLRDDGTWAVPPDTNTTYSAATTSANGLMSSSDKTKLNGIAAGAQVNNVVVSTSQPSSGDVWINPDGQSDLTSLTNRVASLEEDTGWINLPLVSGVSAVRSRYRRKNGVVYIEIINLTGWTTQTTFATLPVGFRPDTASINNTYRWACPTTGANWTRPEFKTDGGICIFTTTTTAGAWTDVIVSYIPAGY